MYGKVIVDKGSEKPLSRNVTFLQLDLLFPRFPQRARNFGKPIYDMPVIILHMGKAAGTAVFDSIRKICIIPAALIIQTI